MLMEGRREMLEQPILKDPIMEYRAMLGMREGSDADDRETWFHRGMLAMGLVLETHARMHESVRGIELEDTHNSTVASALRSAVQSAGIANEVESTYDKLIERRRLSEQETEVVRPPSLRTDDAWPGASQHGSVSSGALWPGEAELARRSASSAAAGSPPAQLSFDSGGVLPGEDSLRELAARQRERARAIERGELRTSWGRTLRARSTSGPAQSFGSEGSLDEPSA